MYSDLSSSVPGSQADQSIEPLALPPLDDETDSHEWQACDGCFGNVRDVQICKSICGWCCNRNEWKIMIMTVELIVCWTRGEDNPQLAAFNTDRRENDEKPGFSGSLTGNQKLLELIAINTQAHHTFLGRR